MKIKIRKALKELFYLEWHYKVKSISFFSKMNDEGKYEIINSLFWYIPQKDRDRWIYNYILCMNESLFFFFFISVCRLIRLIKSV